MSVKVTVYKNGEVYVRGNRVLTDEIEHQIWEGVKHELERYGKRW